MVAIAAVEEKLIYECGSSWRSFADCIRSSAKNCADSDSVCCAPSEEDKTPSQDEKERANKVMAKLQQIRALSKDCEVN